MRLWTYWPSLTSLFAGRQPSYLSAGMSILEFCVYILFLKEKRVLILQLISSFRLIIFWYLKPSRLERQSLVTNTSAPFLSITWISISTISKFATSSEKVKCADKVVHKIICTIVYLDTLIIISGTHLAPVPPVNLWSYNPISIQFRCVSLSRCESLPTYSQSHIDHSLGECPHTHCRWARPPNLTLMQMLVNGVWTVGNQRWIRIKRHLF